MNGVLLASVRTFSNEPWHLYNDDDSRGADRRGGTAAASIDRLNKEDLTRMDESAGEITSDLVDLAGCSLAALDSYGDRVLAPAIAPLLRQIDNPTDSIGGHNS